MKLKFPQRCPIDGQLTHLPPRATYMRRWTGSALVQIMAWHQTSDKPLSEPVLIYCQLHSLEQISVKFELEFYHFHWGKCIRKCHLPNWQPFCLGRDSWGNGQWQTTASTFPVTLEQWMTWDVCGLRSPSLQSSHIGCLISSFEKNDCKIWRVHCCNHKDTRTMLNHIGSNVINLRDPSEPQGIRDHNYEDVMTVSEWLRTMTWRCPFQHVNVTMVTEPPLNGGQITGHSALLPLWRFTKLCSA